STSTFWPSWHFWYFPISSTTSGSNVAAWYKQTALPSLLLQLRQFLFVLLTGTKKEAIHRTASFAYEFRNQLQLEDEIYLFFFRRIHVGVSRSSPSRMVLLVPLKRPDSSWLRLKSP